MPTSRRADPRPVDAGVLAALGLPRHDDEASKHDRGSVLVVGGTVETPGAALLAGLAALRAGAGRLRLAVPAPVAAALAVAIPEARVVPLDPGDDGAIAPRAAARVADLAASSDAVLVGVGALDPAPVGPVLDAVLDGADGTVVLDAGAVAAAGSRHGALRRVAGRCALIPNRNELDGLGFGGDVPQAPCAAAAALGCVVAARDARTFIAAPDGRCWVDGAGTLGLATSGSGDVAAGIAAGLAARGAGPDAVAVWAAHVHGRAGERLARRVAPLGFLARELLDEIPGVLAELGGA